MAQRRSYLLEGTLSRRVDWWMGPGERHAENMAQICERPFTKWREEKHNYLRNIWMEGEESFVNLHFAKGLFALLIKFFWCTNAPLQLGIKKRGASWDVLSTTWQGIRISRLNQNLLIYKFFISLFIPRGCFFFNKKKTQLHYYNYVYESNKR